MSVVPLPDIEGGGDPPRPAPTHRRRWTMLILVLTLALGVLLPPYVNLKRIRARLETSIGGALGRKVTIGGATLRLLPRPGLNISNFVVYDDPAISAEPMIRADSVTALLRLTSLWRGRLEVASLSLQYPSLNLVRAAGGQWNVEALLARASQVPSAPTTLPRAEARPRFPYIEAEGGRINFKIGAEKKVFTLTDADFSLWLEREDEWNMRLNARPVRTDFNLSDTGRLRLSGTFRRAASFRDTPVKLRVTLDRAQLGQLTTLVYDRDRGWRGTASVTADLAGTPADLQFAVDAAVSDFRRYDIMTAGAFSLRSRCVGKYSVDTGTVSSIQCALPAGDGQIEVRGEVEALFQSPVYDLSISARDFPMQELVLFAQHAKRDLPPDLGATGSVDAAFVVRTVPPDPQAPQVWTGGGSTKAFVLRSQSLGADLVLGRVRFAVAPTQVATPRGRFKPDYQHLQLVVPEFKVSLGAATPASASAALTRAQYAVRLEGDADLGRLLGVAHGLGLAAPHRTITGAARADLDVVGAWAGFPAPLAIGNLQLKNVAADLAGVNEPVKLASATVSLAGDAITIGNINATFPASQVAVEGSVSFPRRCDFTAACAVRFDLRSDQVSTDELNRLLNPQLRDSHWYSFVSGGSPDAKALARLDAHGRISVARLLIKSVVATRVSAQLDLAGGSAALSDVRADIFGGSHLGQWQADFTSGEPVYSASGSFDTLALPQISTAMHDNWAAGTVSATYHVTMSGRSSGELVASLAGSTDFIWKDGILRHISLHGAEPLRFRRFRGHAELKDDTLSIGDSSMEAASGIYQVSGTASLAREIDVKLVPRAGPVITIDGSLVKPRVTTEKAAEAKFKP